MQSCSFVLRAGGARGCFQIKGMSDTFLRTVHVPASACYFAVYEAVKSALIKPGQRWKLGPVSCSWLVGATA